MRACNLTPPEIEYICAHANGSLAFDRKEVAVLKQGFGEFAARIPVSSIKGVLGHPFGAAGAFQVATSALAIEKQMIPATQNLTNPDVECDLNHVRRIPQQVRVNSALITSYGYGGTNSYVILGRPR
jgi:3-oxoacyl-(acyl-carrier-protein) synthase